MENKFSNSHVLAQFQSLRSQVTGCADDAEIFLTGLRDFRSHKSVDSFLIGVVRNDFACVRDYAAGLDSGLILSRFKAPYNRSLIYEGVLIEQIIVPSYPREKYPSNARPVNLIASTAGFQGNRAVAMFPENFVTNLAPTRSNPVYYFIDKFVHRFKAVTLPFINSGRVNAHAFDELCDLSDENLQLISSIWVLMHEHFHTTGALPIPEYLETKSSRSTAALEELRVDLLTILASLEDYRNGMGQLFKGVAQFVLAERLIRYPIEAHPAKDYDARSSILLANLLEHHGALSVSPDQLTIHAERLEVSIHAERLEVSIHAIVDDINKLESSIAELGRIEQKEALVGFVKRHSLLSADASFQNLPVFEGASRYA